MTSWLEIDGSTGEGGGQVLRTCLALSILCQQPVRIHRIRQGRSKPGLQPQHLQSVKAAGTICAAQMSGVALQSQSLTFLPGGIKPGNYQFDIGTAGATSLVLQTILLPLARAGGRTRVTITGGTHVPWSPPFEFIEGHYLPLLKMMGIKAEASLTRCGFYPQGNGQIQATVSPARQIDPLQIPTRGELQSIRGISAVGNLSIEIATRQKHQALRQLEPYFTNTKVKTIQAPSYGKGTYIFLSAQCAAGRGCSSALGAPGKRAEIVADEAVSRLLAFLESGASLDPLIADQLLLPCALAGSASHFTTSEITSHLQTNARIIEQFGLAEIRIFEGPHNTGTVEIDPA